MAETRTPQVGDLVSHEGCWGAVGDTTPVPGREMQQLAMRIDEGQKAGVDTIELEQHLAEMALDSANYIVPGPFTIRALRNRAALSDDGEAASILSFTVFENELHIVECRTDELVWLEEDGAWMLPGRLLSREQRETWQKAVGVKQGPKAEDHIDARAFLRFRGLIETPAAVEEV